MKEVKSGENDPIFRVLRIPFVGMWLDSVDLRLNRRKAKIIPVAEPQRTLKWMPHVVRPGQSQINYNKDNA